MIVPLGRVLLAEERPILEQHGLNMWGYVVLDALGEESTRSQVALADGVKADKTRLIGVLDALQERGLIERGPDPFDRRLHIVGLSPSGRKLRARVQKQIQENERRLLQRLDERTRKSFLEALSILSTDAESAFGN